MDDLTPTSLLDVRFGLVITKAASPHTAWADPVCLVENGITNGIPTDPLIVRS